MAAVVIVTPTMQDHADILLARAEKWARGRRNRDGLEFILFASSRTLADGTPIMNMTRADGIACTCPGHRHRDICAHVIAVREHNRRQAQAVQAGRRQTTYTDLFGVCEVRGCDDERERGELFCAAHRLVDAF